MPSQVSDQPHKNILPSLGQPSAAPTYVEFAGVEDPVCQRATPPDCNLKHSLILVFSVDKRATLWV